MAHKMDFRRSPYLKVGKGRTKICIPEQLPSDSSENVVVTLFNEENELVPTTTDDSVFDESILSTSCKRKLESEILAVSHATPKRKSDNFKQLQSYWESKIAGKSCTTSMPEVIKSKYNLKVNDSDTTPMESESHYESPIDETRNRYIENTATVCTPSKSAKQLTWEYTQLIESVLKKGPSLVQMESDIVDSDIHIDLESHTYIDSEYDFIEDDTPIERISLKEFRQSNCTTPMKAVATNVLESPPTFDPKKFSIKKAKTLQVKVPISPLNSSRSGCKMVNITNENDGSQLVAALKESDLMPPPSSVPKAYSTRKPATSSPKNTPKLGKHIHKLCQTLFEDNEFSASDLTPFSPRVGVKRKRSSLRRLLSLDIGNYSQLYSSLELDEETPQKLSLFTSKSSVTATIESNGEVRTDFNTSVDNDAENSVIQQPSKAAEIEINECSTIVPKNLSKATETVDEKDSFFDLSLKCHHTETEQSFFDISNISAIENDTKEIKNLDCSPENHSELYTPEIVKLSVGRKILILEKGQTTLNETMISDMDTSLDGSCLNVVVANAVSTVVEQYIGANIHVSKTDDASQIEDNCKTNSEHASVINVDIDNVEICDDGRVNEFVPELCDHHISVGDLRSSLNEISGYTEPDYEYDADTSDVSRDSYSNTSQTMSPGYEYVLRQPPTIAAIEVNVNSEYVAATDILDLDEHQSYDTTTVHGPESLNTLCVNSLTKMYVVKLMPEGRPVHSNTYLSVPIAIDVTNNNAEASNDIENCKPQSGKLRNQRSTDTIYTSDTNSAYATDHSDSDTLNEYSHIVTKSSNLKRPRCLKFDSEDDSSDSNIPSLKLPRTTLTDKHFPDSFENNNGWKLQSDHVNTSELSSTNELESEDELKTLSEIDSEDQFERSFLSDMEYPESLNSSQAYCDSSKVWSQTGSICGETRDTNLVSSKQQDKWYLTSLASNKWQNDQVVESTLGFIQYSSMDETLPVYTINVPTFPKCAPTPPSATPSASYAPPSLSCMPSIPCSSPQPLNLSYTGEMDYNNKEFKVNKLETGESDSDNNKKLTCDLQDPLVPLNNPRVFYVPSGCSEPRVATLEQNHSTVWREIGMGNVSYSFEPSPESTQYAIECYNAVFGAPANQKWSAAGPEYVSTPMNLNPSIHPNFVSGQSLPEQLFYAPHTDTAPLVGFNNYVDGNSGLPAVAGITIPLESSLPLLNSEQMFPISDRQKFASGAQETRQQASEQDRMTTSYNDDNHSARMENSVAGYESSGNTTEGSSSDSENNLMKMMEKSVRNILNEKKAKPNDDYFKLSEGLKHVRPYVISGRMSSVYLMALAKKTDLVNCMFDDALNENGDIHEWIVEKCRSNTPAILARDLVFRLFTLEELENVNLNMLARKKRFKAIRKCVGKQIPVKLTNHVWNNKCLKLIKSSVSTLFKHRVRHVQHFLEMHAGCL